MSTRIFIDAYSIEVESGTGMPIFVEDSTWRQFGIVGTNYCGPGYAGGVLLSAGQGADYEIPSSGQVDAPCKTHDEDTDLLKTSQNPAADRITADYKLVNGMEALVDSGQLSPRDLAKCRVRSCIPTTRHANLPAWRVPLESNWPVGFIM